MHRSKRRQNFPPGFVQFVGNAMREHVRGAIRLTAAAVPDLPVLETGHKDAAQLINLTNHLSKHRLDALILKMVNRGDAPDFISLARPPHAGIERANGVFDRLPKSWQGAFLLKRRAKGRPIKHGCHQLQRIDIREAGEVVHEPSDFCFSVRKLDA